MAQKPGRMTAQPAPTTNERALTDIRGGTVLRAVLKHLAGDDQCNWGDEVVAGAPAKFRVCPVPK